MSAILEVNDVSVTFDGFKAINNLSLSIDKGELRAIIGPNGAGKTTFMDIVTGKTRPDSGKVEWGWPSRNLLKLSVSEIARLGIGRKFQRPTVFEHQTVKDNLILSLNKKRNPVSALFYIASEADLSKVEDLSLEIGLEDSLNRIAGELSHGQKQWLEIGMLLAQDPKLLLVDEPAAGMTMAERKHTTDLLKRTAGKHAVIVVEHDMDFIRRLDCRVTVLHEGAVLAEGSLDFVSKNQEVKNVYLGR